jgi:hypothetical protein
MIRALVIAGVLLVGCSKSTSRRCGWAFAHLQSAGVFGGDTYGDEALVFGMSCTAFTDDDYKCIDAMKTKKDGDACKHAQEVTVAQMDALGKADDKGRADAPAELASAICGCRDLACVVAIGESRKDAILAIGPGSNTAKIKACLEHIGPSVAPAH